MNFPDIVKHITGRAPKPWGSGPAEIGAGVLYYQIASKGSPAPSNDLYNKLVAQESTLLVVNSDKPSPVAFRAGEVPVPKFMLLTFINAVVDDKAKASLLLPSLGGCTIKEAAEAVRLTMARDKSLTPKGLMQTRKTCFQGARGLTQVDPDQPFYDPPQALLDWIAKEKAYFLNGVDRRLVPRGLLMDGPPGCGKTEAAKWLANALGIPLYRIDVGAVKEKYVGSSEANLLSALQQLDSEEPCVVLFDETEKIFARGGGEHDGNTTTSLLSQMLWWLAEHRTRVLAILTTNDIRSLPPELYREGRIDAVLVFPGLEKAAAAAFLKAVLGTFGEAGKQALAAGLWPKPLARLFAERSLPGSEPPTVSHAAVTQLAFAMIKLSSK